LTRKIYDSPVPCPSCRSREVRKMGFRIVQKMGKVQRFQCQKCGKTFSERYVTVNR
jgi:transposase-like protein